MGQETFGRRTRIMAVLFGALASSLAISACRDATQIDLELSSNVCLPNRTSYAITVVDPTATQSVLALRAPGEETGPVIVDLGNVFAACPTKGSFFDLGAATLVPTSENKTVLVQIVLGLDGERADHCREAAGNPKCVFARRRIGFVEHQRVTVPVFLDGLRCAGKDCNAADKTCFAGGCVSATADRCADGTCLTEAEAANGGGTPKDAPKPVDGGFELPDGAKVEVDGAPMPVGDSSFEDVGIGEGSADGATSTDAEAPDASSTCLLGTGTGCSSSQFSGSDGGFVAGTCCTRPVAQPVTRSCEGPFMACGGSDPLNFKVCTSNADCGGESCHLERGKTLGICGSPSPCVPSDGGAAVIGRGMGCANPASSFNNCCLPTLDCVTKYAGAPAGVCLDKP